jgi:branched-chain amino acid aminotransferase
LGINVPWPDDILRRALGEVAQGADCVLRLTLTRGPMARGILPAGIPGLETVLITAGTLPRPLPPARLIVAASTRRNEFSPLSRIKSLNYGDGILARQEAAAAGADDAFLLNTQGDLAEATASSVVLVLDGGLVTPRVEDGALPGIARGRLLTARVVREARISADDVGRVEGAVLINALGWRRVVCIGTTALDPDHAALSAVTQSEHF